MGQSTHIIGGSFRRGLNSVVTFSTRLAVQPLPLYKSNGRKSKMAASYFCIQPSDWPVGLYASIQVKLYVYKATKYYRNRVLKKISGSVDSCFALTFLAL